MLKNSTVSSFLVLLFLLVLAVSAFGKPSDDRVWREVDDSYFRQRPVERFTSSQAYTTYRLNKTALREILDSAPQEFETLGESSSIILTLPMPDGSFQRFAIKESPIMEAGLAEQYPEIKTYLGQGLDNPTATTRFDLTPHGFHGMILSDQGTIYIDPYSRDNTGSYISFNKGDLRANPNPFVCEFKSPKDQIDFFSSRDYKIYTDTPNIVVNGGTLRTYRLALAATNEYALAVGSNTIAGTIAAQVTTMNRVNGIYERDLSIRMNIIGNNNLIVYAGDNTSCGGSCTSSTDPYTNSNGSTMLGQNTTNLNTVIGTANYDIGHVFSTGGGGVATLNGPCSSNKARGVTGLPNPTGDAFDVDYVAHEMGHQWGGNHTFNGSTGSCSGGNRSAANAYEPGSGTTIQAYAGICSPQNTQLNSNDYFHVRSLEEMAAFSNNAGTGGSCSMNTASGNTPPAVSISGGTTFNIPRNTPFALTAIATDVDGDTLTYNWEEFSLGAAGAPSSTANAPMMRSYTATTSPTRNFPSLPYILNSDNVPPTTFTGVSPAGANCGASTCITGEFLSSIARTMPFQVTVRDNRAGGGGIRSVQASVVVDVNSGPFKVTAQDSLAPNWQGGTTQTVTWNVANTNVAPVNAANVNILLSLDGGLTFPAVLATNTPNDGSENISSPNIATTMARIKVEAVGNIFFDISNVNFTIMATTAAHASIEGRVLTPGGFGIGNAVLTLLNTGSNEVSIATTNQFGYFSIEELPVGEFYILTVDRKGINFPVNQQAFSLFNDMTGLNFISSQ